DPDTGQAIPDSTGTVTVTGAGGSETFMNAVAVVDGVAGGTIDEARTWTIIREWEVNAGASTVTAYTTHEIEVSVGGNSYPATFTWDGNNNDAASNFGEPACRMTNGLCRYQVAEVAVDDDP